MSLANTAAEYMLSDALLPDRKAIHSKRLRLELPADRILKFVSVGLPLLLVSLALAQEISTGSQISCFPPNNFSIRQASYVDKYCWDSLMHYEFDNSGTPTNKSLWIHKIFPYSLLVIAVTMYFPTLLWRYTAASSLNSDLFFIIDELDKSYNRSIRLVQHIMKVQQTCPDSQVFWAELEKARSERYFEFPLLERYLACKQRSYYLVGMYFLKNILFLIFITVTCLYLVFFHINILYQDEFNCDIRSGLLKTDPTIPALIHCKLVSLSVFQVISISNGAVYVLLVPIIIYNLVKFCCWDKRFLSVYEMLPAFDLLSKKMLGCPVNDLNVIILFLRANISELKSFSRLNVLCVLKDSTSQDQNIDTIVDFMTLLAGVEMSKPKILDNTVCPQDPHDLYPHNECYGKFQSH
uniref:Pannexin n=1 Tax=Geotrypetes seraphini TaxID=260995 RepID=A0A6P8NR87_GEOSA|nr:pannexin-3 [Geotrypetes seraphini]